MAATDAVLRRMTWATMPESERAALCHRGLDEIFDPGLRASIGRIIDDVREHGDEAGAALARTSGFLRSQLARRLTTYKVPQLGFVYDDSIEAGIALARLIDEAVAEDAKHPRDDA